MISQYSVYMTRTTVKGSVRYYKLDVEQTLFGGYCVERKYGNVKFKSHTGLKKNYFDETNQALGFFDKILQNKQKKGYR